MGKTNNNSTGDEPKPATTVDEHKASLATGALESIVSNANNKRGGVGDLKNSDDYKAAR
jgi:hypothetical protein